MDCSQTGEEKIMDNLQLPKYIRDVYTCVQTFKGQFFSMEDLQPTTGLEMEDVIKAVKYLQSKNIIVLSDDDYWSISHEKGWSLVEQEKEK